MGTCYQMNKLCTKLHQHVATIIYEVKQMFIQLHSITILAIECYIRIQHFSQRNVPSKCFSSIQSVCFKLVGVFKEFLDGHDMHCTIVSSTLWQILSLSGSESCSEQCFSLFHERYSREKFKGFIFCISLCLSLKSL